MAGASIDTRRSGSGKALGRRSSARRMLVGLAALAAAGCVHAPAYGAEAPVVTTAAGKLRGVSEDGIAVFRGIPYAEAPIAERRWRPPVAKAAWDGTLDATRFGAPCFQPQARPTASNIYAEELAPMSEDCLSLNVWMPEDAENAPVLVWIHGGALVAGTSGLGMYDGARLAKEGTIVVSLNYRLGALGFLAHPGLSAESPQGISGNYGLLDQIEALRWIERNIAGFGGDPENVTIAGESAGALTVMALMTSPRARGLFDKAVMQSAYMISLPALAEAQNGHPSAESIGSWLEQQLEVEDVAALRELGAREVTERSTAAGYPTWLTVDGAVIPRQIAETFDRGEQAPVPVLAGFNSGEIRSLRRLLAPAPDTAEEYEAKIRAAYGEDADRFLAIYPSATIDESLLGATRDALYGWTTQRLGEKQAAIGSAAYLYLFDHGYPAADEAGLRAFHAAEIPFMFGTIWNTTENWPRIPRSDEQRALSDAMVGYWTSFARSGIPTAAGQVDWPRFGSEEAFMVFDGAPFVRRDVLGDRYDLYEETVCRRRVAGDQQWNWNVGIAAEPLPPKAAQCR